ANSGDTMLDNAMKSKDSKMIEFFIKKWSGIRQTI
ncbi:hypothetical protein CUA46_22830, partial [Shigella boydii]